MQDNQSTLPAGAALPFQHRGHGFFLKALLRSRFGFLSGSSRAVARSQQIGFRTLDLALLALLFATTLVGSGCRTTAIRHVSDPAPAIARLQAGGSLQAEVDDLVRPLVARGEVYGMVVGVVTPDGATHTFPYGQTGHPGDSQPPGADALFEIGSVSKVFVAALLARLVEEGQLRYDDTVRSILPTDVLVSADVGQVTLYELITHTSGLPREPFTLTQLSFFISYLVTGHNLYAYLNKPYLYAYLRHCHLKPKEQRKFFYSNLGIGLLGHLIEVKTGRRVTDLIVEKICAPLNMRDSVFALDAPQQERLTVGHTGNQACWKPANSPVAPWDMGEIMRSPVGMYSTANDLLIFAKANLGMLHHPLELILGSTQRAQVETPRGAEALGWIINRFNNGRVTLTFKDGMVAGYCSYIGLNRDARVAVVVLRNKFNWDDRVGHNLLLRLSGTYASSQMNTAGNRKR
jgi:CubicO group peptidase (beta-lactamase class C family)